MTIEVGERLPQGEFKTMTKDGVISLDVDSVFKDQRVALFSVPAVFTPGCSGVHLPSYVNAYESIMNKGFDTIACLSVSDAWVMDAWAESYEAKGKVLMLADGNAAYVKQLGLESDLTPFGMGMRSKRFSMVVVDGRVESLNIDERKIESTNALHTCALK